MKKTKILTLLTAMIVTGSTTVYAKLPSNTIIIGKDAFDSSYLFDANHASEINTKFNNLEQGASVFYIDERSSINDIFKPSKSFTEKDLSTSIGNNINYLSNSSSRLQNYTFNGSEYIVQSYSPKINLDISYNKIASSKSMLTITYKGMVNSEGLDGAPDKIGISGTDLKCSLNDGNASMYYFSSAKKLPIVVYDDHNNILAKGQANFSSIKIGQTISISCDLTKRDTLMKLESNSGNFQNSGEVNVFDGYTYYSNTADKGKLYKINSDGSENSVLTEETVKSICVKNVNGETWIYYANMSDGGKLYKVKSDGIGRTKVSDNKTLAIAASNYENNKLLYFINLSDSNKIYSIDTTNDSVEKLCDDPADSINVINNDVYYNNTAKFARMYKYSNGVSSEVSEYNSINGIKRFIGTNEKDFFICTFGGDIYRGNKKLELSIYNKNTNKVKPDKASNINIIGDYIYYKSENDGGKLYRVGVEGGTSEQVVSSSIDNIYVVNSENLYYSKGSRLTKLNVALNDLGKITFVSEQLKKPSQNQKILKIDDSKLKFDTPDSNAKLSDLEKNMPEIVNVTFADYSTKNVPVYWEINKPNLVNNSRVYTGVLVGYGTKINFVLTMPSINPPEDTTNIIMDGGTKKTIVSVDKVNSGDVIKVYTNKEDSKNTATLLGQATASSKGKAIVSNLSLSEDIKNIYITRTEKGKKESEKVKIKNNLLKTPELISAEDLDQNNIGIDGTDITIKVGLGEFDKKQVYILPKGKFMESGSTDALTGYDLSDSGLWIKDSTDSSKYTGTSKINKDSLGNAFTTGQYDFCILCEKNGDKYISSIKTATLKEEIKTSNLKVDVQPSDKFIKGLAPDSGINITITGTDINGSRVDSSTKLSNLTILGNGSPLKDGNYTISNNVISLNKYYLDSLNSGVCLMAIKNKDMGLNQTISLIVSEQQSLITAKVTPYDKFKAGNPASNQSITINMQEKSKTGEYIKLDKSKLELNYEGTTVNSSFYDISQSGNDNVITLKTEFLKALHYGDNNISIKDTATNLSTSVVISVNSAARIELTGLNGVNKDNISFSKGTDSDLKFSVTQINDNNIPISGTKLDTLQIVKGSYILKKGEEYTVDGNVVALKKEYLNALLSGSTEIQFKLGSLTSSIKVNVK